MVATAEQLSCSPQERLRVGRGDDYDVALSRANLETFRDTARSATRALQALRALEALLGRYPAAPSMSPAAFDARRGRFPRACPRSCSSAGPTSSRRSAASPRRSTAEQAKAARLPRISLTASVDSLRASSSC